MMPPATVLVPPRLILYFESLHSAARRCRLDIELQSIADEVAAAVNGLNAQFVSILRNVKEWLFGSEAGIQTARQRMGGLSQIDFTLHENPNPTAASDDTTIYCNMDRIFKQTIEGFTYVDLQRRTRFQDSDNDAITACKKGTAVDGRNPRGVAIWMGALGTTLDLCKRFLYKAQNVRYHFHNRLSALTSCKRNGNLPRAYKPHGSETPSPTKRSNL